MSIFKAYDIRGVYPAELNEEAAERIGFAAGRVLGKTVAVGMDMRVSSPSLKEAFIRGLNACGTHVIDIGVVPTPLVYFASAFYRLGAVNVTASHNPKEFNGFKFCREGGVCLSYESGIADIERISAGPKGTGHVKSMEERNVVEEYIRHCTSNASLARPLKIVIDAGNGTAGLVAPEIFRRLGCEVTELYCEPDGDFPNHTPNPIEKHTLKDLQAKVVETGADLGIAYDGDGDRVGFVDGAGGIIENNAAFALLIMSVLSSRPGGKVIFDISCSKMIEDVIRQNGGTPVVSRVGHSYIQEALIGKGCDFAGETSGHYYFRQNFSYDDGIFASVKFAGIAAGIDIRKAIEDLPKYHTSDDTRIFCDDARKFRAVDMIKDAMLRQGHRVIDIDGVKVVFDDGWALMRASNTQPAIVCRWESGDREAFERVGNFVREQVQHAIERA